MKEMNVQNFEEKKWKKWAGTPNPTLNCEEEQKKRPINLNGSSIILNFYYKKKKEGWKTIEKKENS